MTSVQMPHEILRSTESSVSHCTIPDKEFVWDKCVCVCVPNEPQIHGLGQIHVGIPMNEPFNLPLFIKFKNFETNLKLLPRFWPKLMNLNRGMVCDNLVQNDIV